MRTPYGPPDPMIRSSRRHEQRLPEARRLIFAGKYGEAHDLIGEKMMARPLQQMPYEPVGDLTLSFPGHGAVNDYRRELDLDTATVSVRYTVNGVRFSREVFSSPVNQVVVVRLTADQPGQVSFTATMKTPQKATVATEGRDTLVLRGRNGSARGIAGALKFEARVRAFAQGGEITTAADSLTITAADSATLLLAGATSYRSFKDVSGDPELATKNCLAKAGRRTFDELRHSHVAEHQRLFRRVHLDLGVTDAARLPTNERHREVRPRKRPCNSLRCTFSSAATC